jgi:hypothetical protein
MKVICSIVELLNQIIRMDRTCSFDGRNAYIISVRKPLGCRLESGEYSPGGGRCSRKDGIVLAYVNVLL